MIGHLKIGSLRFAFVYKYRYPKNPEILDRFTTWRDWRIGLFFKRSKIVGHKNHKNPNKWNDNLVKQYMVGLNLLIWKVWFTVHKGKTLKLEIKD